jgi:tRNA pseudouridine38-40 synthase
LWQAARPRTIGAVERTICLLVAYDGNEFHGWQQQPGLRTVQGILEQALRRVVRHQVDLVGSGRTDSGVHAAGHVSSFVTTCRLPPEKLRHAIGSRLPKDVSVIAARDVAPGFHATLNAASKLYRYRIHNVRGRPVEHQRQPYTYHYWEPLDVERMGAGARHFVGEMDFSAMANAGPARETMIRRVLRCDIDRHLDEIRIDVEGTGFLYKQVRNMVGTLLNVGRGHWEPDRVAVVLSSRDRSAAGATAPARGLCLMWVRYPAELMRPPCEAWAASR